MALGGGRGCSGGADARCGLCSGFPKVHGVSAAVKHAPPFVPASGPRRPSTPPAPHFQSGECIKIHSPAAAVYPPRHLPFRGSRCGGKSYGPPRAREHGTRADPLQRQDTRVGRFDNHPVRPHAAPAPIPPSREARGALRIAPGRRFSRAAPHLRQRPGPFSSMIPVSLARTASASERRPLASAPAPRSNPPKTRGSQRTHALTHSRTHALTHSRTHALTHSRTHTLTHRPCASA